MNHYLCNPVNTTYRYQFIKNPMDGSIDINRESADPSLIFFKGNYYIFASMTLDVWVSEDLAEWKNYRLPDELPLYGYAPDIRVVGDYVYVCANESEDKCHFYRSKDIIHGPYEKIDGSFAFLDPNIFADDNGRLYFYWGLSCNEPIYGIELDPHTLNVIGEKQALIYANPFVKGFERIGEDNSILPVNDEELEVRYQSVLKQQGIKDEATIPQQLQQTFKDILRDAPYLEGAWMNKFGDKYYLQYAAPGTQFNVYGDGVYVADHPLGPFHLAANNPYSYKPGGYITGAGHGSTTKDGAGNLWHAATSRISINHQFERRIGIWPAGIDEDGELFCNQRYGDWPVKIEPGKLDPWAKPDWNLLSYNKTARASSSYEMNQVGNAFDENIRTWWQAASSQAGEWLEVDLGKVCDVHAIQVNFADDNLSVAGAELKIPSGENRYISEDEHYTRWILEGSSDQVEYFVIADKSDVKTDLSHDFIVSESGFKVRYIRLMIVAVPYGQKPAISGLRIFGKGNGSLPEKSQYEAVRRGAIDMEVLIKPSNAVGYNILWGHHPEKLYHSYLIFDHQQRIGALVKDTTYYVRVDAFNESGITEGDVIQLTEEIKR